MHFVCTQSICPGGLGYGGEQDQWEEDERRELSVWEKGQEVVEERGRRHTDEKLRCVFLARAFAELVEVVFWNCSVPRIPFFS